MFDSTPVFAIMHKPGFCNRREDRDERGRYFCDEKSEGDAGTSYELFEEEKVRHRSSNPASYCKFRDKVSTRTAIAKSPYKAECFCAMLFISLFCAANISAYKTPVGIADPKNYFGGFDPMGSPNPDPRIYCPNWAINQPNSVSNGQSNDCYYVDNTGLSGACTDVSNPYGYPGRPRCTVPSDIELRPGSYIEVHGDGGSGNYIYTSFYPLGAGTPNAPIWFVGVNSPVFNSAAKIGSHSSSYTNISYLVFDGLIFRGDGAFDIRPGWEDKYVDHIVVRNCIMDGGNRATNGSGINVGFFGAKFTNSYTSYIVVYKNDIKNYGQWDAPGEEVGFIPQNNTKYIWVLDNEIHGMAEDGLGGAPSGAHTCDFYYIGRNHIYNNQTNAIDIKQVNHIVISENTVHGYEHTAYSSGPSSAILLHSGGGDTTGPYAYLHYPADASVLFNTVYDGNGGISTQSGVGTLRIIGNVVYNQRLPKDGSNLAGHPEYYPTSAYNQGFGIFLVGIRDDGWIVNNSVYGCQSGIQIPDDPAVYSDTAAYYIGYRTFYNGEYYACIKADGDTGITGISPADGSHWRKVRIQLWGNIVAETLPLGNDIIWGGANYAKLGFVVDRNLIYNSSREAVIRVGGSTIYNLESLAANTLHCDNCKNSNPMFINISAGNFAPQFGSPLIDASTIGAAGQINAYDNFYSIYGISIAEDISGATRPQGAWWDIGAYEYSGSEEPLSPNSPSGLVVR